MKPKRRTPPLQAKGRFYSTNELIEQVCLMFRQGMPLLSIAMNCGVNYRTVRKILAASPMTDEALLEAPADARYVLVTERGLADDADPAILELNPALAFPWIHSSSLEESKLPAMRRRLATLGAKYGRILVARLVFVDPLQILDQSMTFHPTDPDS